MYYTKVAEYMNANLTSDNVILRKSSNSIFVGIFQTFSPVEWGTNIIDAIGLWLMSLSRIMITLNVSGTHLHIIYIKSLWIRSIWFMKISFFLVLGNRMPFSYRLMEERVLAVGVMFICMIQIIYCNLTEEIFNMVTLFSLLLLKEIR